MKVGHWEVYFFFALKGYDEEAILDLLYDLDAPDDIMLHAMRKMKKGIPNEGFTFTNGYRKVAAVVIGPTTSGAEFQNSFMHELRHLIDSIAFDSGIHLYGEPVAYLTGDTAMELADVVCKLGCKDCRNR